MTKTNARLFSSSDISILIVASGDPSYPSSWAFLSINACVTSLYGFRHLLFCWHVSRGSQAYPEEMLGHHLEESSTPPRGRKTGQSVLDKDTLLPILSFLVLKFRQDRGMLEIWENFPAIIQAHVPCLRTHKTFPSLLVTLEEGSYDQGSSLVVFCEISWSNGKGKWVWKY